MNSEATPETERGRQSVHEHTEKQDDQVADLSKTLEKIDRKLVEIAEGALEAQ